MIRLTVTFDDQTGRALFKLAHREMRNPRNQAALLIRMKLIELGVLQDEPMDCIRSTNHAGGGP